MSELTAIITCANTNGKIHHLSETLYRTAQLDLFKIILVMDDSITERDDSEINSIIKNSPETFTIIRGSFKSPGAARNAGMEAVKTQYLTFWDFDDSPVLGAINLSLQDIPLETDVIVLDFLRRDEISGKYLSRNHDEASLYKLARSCGIWRMIFKTTAIDHVRFLDISMGEDQLFLHQIRLGDLTITRIHLVGYIYSVNFPNSLTTSKSKIDDLSAASEAIKSEFKILSKRSKYFAANLVVRQAITILKYSSMKSRIFTLVSIFLHPSYALSLLTTIIRGT